MKTLILAQPGRIELTDTPEPGNPPPGHAMLRVRRVGICGTDWHAFHGRQPFFSYPRILGHELGVEIEQVNDPASPLRAGDRCAVEPYFYCGRCVACRAGKTNCCANLQTYGVHIDGGMRQRVVLPTRNLHKSDTLSLDQLALVETLGIGAHAVQRASVNPGEWTLILGAGPIGLSIIPFAQAAGAKLIVADVAPSRRRFGQQQFQLEHVIDARDDLPDALHRITGGELPTLVMDATGNPRSMARTFELVAPGGRIVFVGLFQGQVNFDDPSFHRREITLLATRNSTASDFKRIIAMIEAGQIDTTPWITHRAGCDELVDALPKWLSPHSNLIKAIVEF